MPVIEAGARLVRRWSYRIDRALSTPARSGRSSVRRWPNAFRSVVSTSCSRFVVAVCSGITRGWARVASDAAQSPSSGAEVHVRPAPRCRWWPATRSTAVADPLHVRCLWNGRRFRTFNSIDDFSREAWRSRSTATARHARHRTPERIAPGAATTKPRLDIELTAKSSVVSRRARPRPRPPRTGFFDCPLLSKDARGSPRSRRSPDVTMVNTRSGGRPRQARARRVSSAERAVNLQFSLALIYGESHNVRVSILPPRIVVRVQH